MARCRRSVSVEAAYRCVADGRGRGRRVEGDVKDRAVRQHGVSVCDVDPGGLVRAGAQPATDLHVAVVGAYDHGGLKGLLKGELIDEGPVAQRLLR